MARAVINTLHIIFHFALKIMSWLQLLSPFQWRNWNSKRFSSLPGDKSRSLWARGAWLQMGLATGFPVFWALWACSGPGLPESRGWEEAWLTGSLMNHLEQDCSSPWGAFSSQSWLCPVAMVFLLSPILKIGPILSYFVYLETPLNPSWSKMGINQMGIISNIWNITLESQ